jgi:hypothetical protein
MAQQKDGRVGAMNFPFESALRGPAGDYEISRVIGGFGAFAYCVCANGFVGWEVFGGKAFDLSTYCLVFPTGLAAIIAAAAGSAAVKDRQSATAKVIAETGAVPVAPPAGPPVPVEPKEGES